VEEEREPDETLYAAGSKLEKTTTSAASCPPRVEGVIRNVSPDPSEVHGSRARCSGELELVRARELARRDAERQCMDEILEGESALAGNVEQCRRTRKDHG